MQLRYAYRLDPTPGQRIALSKAFGCARVVFNDAVAARQAAHQAGAPYPTDAELSRALTAAKRTPERAWLAEVSAVVLQQALTDATTAYRNWFASRSGKRKGRKLGAPRFRSRQPLPPVDREVGIDLGLVHFAVLSDGRKIDNPRHARKAAAKLRRAQRELARRRRGSANRAKSRRKVARCHARVGDTRRDWLHKQSTTIIRENQAVYVEDLAVSGLARTRLARSVHDAGWAMFVAMLGYKARRHGRTFGKVDRWFPSTRMCSVCGVIGEAKPLHVREWTCRCGAVHDRDVNAARNILAAGRAESRQTPVEPVSAGTPVPQPAGKQEPTGSAA